jgi:hypothetical protein
MSGLSMLPVMIAAARKAPPIALPIFVVHW